jgi:hypothetical protein
MELVVNQELEPEPLVIRCNTKEGLLRSNYKVVANKNFKSTVKPSLFGIRQAVKSLQYNTDDHLTVALKLIVFTVVLVTLF